MLYLFSRGLGSGVYSPTTTAKAERLKLRTAQTFLSEARAVRRHCNRIGGPMPNDPRTDAGLLTISEAAELVEVSAETCYRLARRGELPGAHKLGRKWRVSRPTLLAYFHSAGN
jgi:excisionase family DNA binding protein